MGYKSASPDVANAKTYYDFKEHSKAFNIISEKEKRMKEEVKSWKSDTTLKEDVTSESQEITEESKEDQSSSDTDVINLKEEFNQLKACVKLNDEIKDKLKENGYDQLDHIANDELIIKLLKQAYAIKIEPRGSVEFDKQIELKNYIKDFEKQVRLLFNKNTNREMDIFFLVTFLCETTKLF